MERRASDVRFAVDRPHAARQEEQLFARLPSHQRRGGSIDCALEAACTRHADNEVGRSALDALVRLPGFAAMSTTDRLALIRLTDGPFLDDGVEAHRRRFASETWKGIQQGLANAFERALRLDRSAQIEVLTGLLREPREPVTLLTSTRGHALIALGWKPGDGRALIDYGRWPVGSARSAWGFVKSPDSIMRRRFLPARHDVYDFTTHRVSMDDERQLIEWLERAFAVNDLRIGPKRCRAFPLSRAFARYAQSLLTIVGKERSAAVERGRARGGQLMEEQQK
jgi:hypothetical protein